MIEFDLRDLLSQSCKDCFVLCGEYNGPIKVLDYTFTIIEGNIRPNVAQLTYA